MKNNKEHLLEAGKAVGQAVNTEKNKYACTKCTFTPHHQTAEQNRKQ